MPRTIVWFRRDLRVSDHAPLSRAAQRGEVIPVFILDPRLLYHPETGVGRVKFMLNCLAHLNQDLAQRGGRLILRYGDPVTVLPQLIQATTAEGIYAYLDCERLYGRIRDAALIQSLTAQQMQIRWFEPSASTPHLIPYPQYRQLWFQDMEAPQLPAPTQISVPIEIQSDPLPSLAELNLTADAKVVPEGSYHQARRLLQEFIAHKAERYYWELSHPGTHITSGLSPYLKFGVISARECYQTLKPLLHSTNPRWQRSAKQFISRLRWGSGFTQRFRYLPQLELRSLYTIFDQEGWTFKADWYQAWREGQTGFPIVDAAARCLQATGGWLSLNFRVRAIYASFLSNLMGLDWRYGALHFMQHLLDGDCPIDHYQWAMQAGVTHCLDKSWTRIYNPEQAAIDRCDPQGLFIKRWVPELADIPVAQLGSPPPVSGYPDPILNYKDARQWRINQLDRLRSTFRQQQNVIPALARLPRNVTPFGLELSPTSMVYDIAWAEQCYPSQLYPEPLMLEALTQKQVADLRTWFVAHVNIEPHRQRTRKTSKKSDPNQVQLSLFDLS